MPTQPTFGELQERFGKPGAVKFVSGNGGLTCVELTSPGGIVHLYTHGAHVTYYEPSGQAPVLWVSEQSLFAPGKAIRGGVPIIFPWFGGKADDKAAPAHGCARAVAWVVEGTEKKGDAVSITLTLGASEATRKWWPHEFEARYTVTVGSTLEMNLAVKNTSSAPFTFEEALHTYFTVSDVRNVKVDGLSGTSYIDKVDGFKRKVQEGPVTISGETDRVYLNTAAVCTINDPGTSRKIIVDKANSNATVVWNPWADKAKGMSDFGDDEWPGMICIETCNASDNSVTLPPEQTHAMKAIVRTQM